MSAGSVSTLPHYLQPGLRLVFIGYNPAIYSAEAGHFYARAGNQFWRHLSESGLAGRTVRPEDDQLLPDEAVAPKKKPDPKAPAPDLGAIRTKLVAEVREYVKGRIVAMAEEEVKGADGNREIKWDVA